MDMHDDNRLELIERYKKQLVESTNIKSSPDEMAVIDSILFRFWQMGWLKEQEWHMLTEDDDGIIHGLPGDDGQYLMSDGKEIWIDEYADGVADGIFLDSGRDVREIKAWKYMPDLPKTDRR